MAAKFENLNDYCDHLYSELFEIKGRIEGFSKGIEHSKSREMHELDAYKKHLDEIAHFIEWKLEIFSKVCPVDWNKYYKDIESTVSVPVMEIEQSDMLTGAGTLGG